MPKKTIDHTDLIILNTLQREGDITNLQLSKRIGLSPSNTLGRVNKLKDLDLLPSAHFLFNKELAGYRELFQVKISIQDKPELQQQIEALLLKDGLVEQLWTIDQPDAFGSLQYKALVRAKSDDSFKEWCHKITQNQQCMLEKEKVGIQLKERSNLKLTYKDLDVLKKLL
ncbi:MAG: winged helix-turn-helix transcriptional regulator [Bacteroidia bacterium]